MKLNTALNLRKKLVGEIAKLKQQIKDKNSYLVGSLNAEKFNIDEIYTKLKAKIDELVSIKYAINEANREIQPKIFVLSEYKALLQFWNEVSVIEGKQLAGYGRETVYDYAVQIDEIKRNEIISEFQTKIDALQEELNTYNYTTEIPWDVVPVSDINNIKL